jgi:hypothetical protein
MSVIFDTLISVYPFWWHVDRDFHAFSDPRWNNSLLQKVGPDPLYPLTLVALVNAASLPTSRARLGLRKPYSWMSLATSPVQPVW